MNSMISIETNDETYGNDIRRFFQTEFPALTQKTSGDVLELLTNAILASGKVRLGPKPSIESQYLIRRHLRKMMEANCPIRFLMPWGSEKPAHYQKVDLAEVAALKTMVCLQERVKAFYEPGVAIRIRVEDLTAASLLTTSPAEQVKEDARIYTSSLLNLHKVLDLSFIEFVPESSIMDEDTFDAEFEAILPYMEAYLFDSEKEFNAHRLRLESFKPLNELGWKGEITDEQREHYRSTYRRLYDMSDGEATRMLARYLSQSLARRRLKMMGDMDWNGEHLGLSFVGPVPGEPTAHASNRVYYRTLPENLSSLHIAPWRAKGYLSISDDVPRVRLASWSENRRYNHAQTVLRRNGETAIVQTDYEVVE